MPAALLICLVVGISDGDTLTARCDTPQGEQNLKVRLAEIDAPEKAQPWGARSRQNLAQLCFGRTAQVRTQAVDRYGRSVARVRCEGLDANAEQVRAGLAWVFDRYARDRSLFAEQDAARASYEACGQTARRSRRGTGVRRGVQPHRGPERSSMAGRCSRHREENCGGWLLRRGAVRTAAATLSITPTVEASVRRAC